MPVVEKPENLADGHGCMRVERAYPDESVWQGAAALRKGKHAFFFHPPQHVEQEAGVRAVSQQGVDHRHLEHVNPFFQCHGGGGAMPVRCAFRF